MAFLIKNQLGVWGENLACKRYIKKGYVLVAKNIYNRKGKMLGELDLVFRSDTHIIFVEVKVKSNDRYGSALSAVTTAKQQKIVRTVKWFLNKFSQYAQLQPRIDVCAIDVSPIDRTRVNVIIIPSAIEINC